MAFNEKKKELREGYDDGASFYGCKRERDGEKIQQKHFHDCLDAPSFKHHAKVQETNKM